ncbi:MAG: hypothetical protein ACI9UT_003635, partial [Flavobacteriales bacterium]
PQTFFFQLSAEFSRVLLASLGVLLRPTEQPDAAWDVRFVTR